MSYFATWGGRDVRWNSRVCFEQWWQFLGKHFLHPEHVLRLNQQPNDKNRQMVSLNFNASGAPSGSVQPSHQTGRDETKSKKQKSSDSDINNCCWLESVFKHGWPGWSYFSEADFGGYSFERSTATPRTCVVNQMNVQPWENTWLAKNMIMHLNCTI